MDTTHLKSSTSLKTPDYGVLLLDMLVNGDEARREVVAGAVPDVFESKGAALSFPDLARVLRDLKQHGYDVDPARIDSDIKLTTPLSQEAFYESIRETFETVDSLHDQLELLRKRGKTENGSWRKFKKASDALWNEVRNVRDQQKSEKGFLKTFFHVYTSQEPLDTVLKDVASFGRYCREQRIAFDGESEQLVRPDTAWDKVKDFRFLVAAGAGLVAGAAGFNPNASAAISWIPDTFMGALPFLAVPFIGLNIFKAFSEKNLMDEKWTLMGFGVTMSAAFGVSILMTDFMSSIGFLTQLDMNSVAESAHEKAEAGVNYARYLTEMIGNPAHHIKELVGASLLGAGIYKLAKNKLDPAMKSAKTGLSALFDKASGLVINKTTAPYIAKAGKETEKACGWMDTAFNQYMKVMGVPAIFLMLARTAQETETDQLMSYMGYYGTVLAGMSVAAAGLTMASVLFGGWSALKPVGKTLSTAFSTSSSAATMPTTKESLSEIGVSEKTRNSVVPLGANFHMMGVMLYLGATVGCANVMFGHDPSLAEQVAVLATTTLMAVGAPGAPAAQIGLLEPVLSEAGLKEDQITKMYAVVFPIDRIADMLQTMLNVWGDMVVAMGVDGGVKKVKNRLSAAFSFGKAANDNSPAANELAANENTQQDPPQRRDMNGPQ